MKFAPLMILALLTSMMALTPASGAESTTTRTKKVTKNRDGSTTIEETETTKTSESSTEAAKATEVSKEADQKSDFAVQVQGKLDTLGAQIKVLKDQAATASSDAKADLEKRAADLDKKRDELKTQLKDVDEKSGNAWKQFRDGMSKSVTELQIGYEKAKNEFAKTAVDDRKDAKSKVKTKK